MALARAAMAVCHFGTVAQGTPTPALPAQLPGHTSTGVSSDGSHGPGPTTALGARKIQGNFSSLQELNIRYKYLMKTQPGKEILKYLHILNLKNENMYN